jgi:hypothetical protein
MTEESGKEKEDLTIVVNGQKKNVRQDELSFSDVVALAFNPVPSGPNVMITVTYRDALGDKKGSLTDGQSVKIQNGTVFNVTATDKS